MDYLTLKWLHVMSSTFLFGTGVGSAFQLFFVSLTREPRAVAAVARTVVIADWLFTATTVVIQPLTGLYMLRLVGLRLEAGWLVWSMALYVLAVACWLPVVWLQVRMRDLAQQAVRENTALPLAYWRCFRAWTLLGIPAFVAFVVIFYLMVHKPA